MNTSKLIACLLMPAMLSFAADSVQWSDLPQKIGHGKMRSDGYEDREYRVVTRDGAVHKGNQLIFGPAGVKVKRWGEWIPREQVTEIRIHREAGLSQALWAPGEAIENRLCGDDDLGFCYLNPIALLSLPVAFGLSVAAAPITLPIAGIRRMLPDKVFRVAP
jgi:hypothetical protein